MCLYTKKPTERERMADIMKKPILLKAKNSSGKQKLYLDYHDEFNDVTATLVGRYNDKDIQIDFDSIKPKQLKRMIKRLKRVYRKVSNDS
jgi:hypothetical protein